MDSNSVHLSHTGMQTDKSVAKKLLYWLQNWYKNHSGNKKPTRPGTVLILLHAETRIKF